MQEDFIRVCATQCYAQDSTLTRALSLMSCSVATILRFLTLFEQGVLCFHFVVIPPNFIASPNRMTAGWGCQKLRI